MTVNTRQDLEEFKKNLSDERRIQLERVIAEKGEEYAIGVLGHLKSQVEYIDSL